MPELPDVELFKSFLESKGLHKEITELEVRSKEVLGDLRPKDLEEALVGKQFSSATRHGKHLFVSVEEEGWLEFHFGMTGFFNYSRTPEDLPGHPRLVFRFPDGNCLVYDCQRKLGEVNLVEDLDDYLERRELGPDALKQVDQQAFIDILSNSRAMAKSTLMSQEKIAGIGNIYSDEILFQAGVHPRVRATNLSEEELERLYEKTKKVLRTAIEKEADPERLPADYLLPRRSPRSPCPRCESEIEKVKVSGRSAYFCPNCQKSP